MNSTSSPTSNPGERTSVVAVIGAMILAMALAVFSIVVQANEPAMNQPTIVLVHGALAESSRWNNVTSKLLGKGYPVIAVKAPAYISGAAPDIGESAASLTGKCPGSTLGPTLAPSFLLVDGSKDLYILQDKYHTQVAVEVPGESHVVMVSHPVALVKLIEAAAATIGI